jgi:hypothetical protein
LFAESVPAQKGVSLESIAEDSNESATSGKSKKQQSAKKTEDKSEVSISENISEDVDVPSAVDSEPLKLELELDDDKKEEEKEDKGHLDTARDVSEMPEDYVSTARSETETAEKTPRSEHSGDDKSEMEGSEKSGSKSVSYSESRSYSSESYSSESESESTITASKSVSKSKSVAKTAEKTTEKSEKKLGFEKTSELEEAIGTDEDISDRFSVESGGDDSDAPAFQLDMTKAISQTAIVDPLAEFSIGDRVLVSGVRAGTLRFKGETKFAAGFFAGVELDTADGTGNGAKDGVTYFSCADNCAIFAPPEKIARLPVDWQEEEEKESELEKAIKMADESLHESLQEEIEEQSLNDSIKSSENTDQKKEDADRKERLVESITDSLTRGLIQDSMKALGDVKGQRQREHEKERDVIDTDNEKVRKDLDDTEKTIAEKKNEDETKDKAADVVTKNLLNEAITEMLGIRKKQTARSSSQEDLGQGEEIEIEEEIVEEPEKEEKKIDNDDEFANFDSDNIGRRGSREAEDILGLSSRRSLVSDAVSVKQVRAEVQSLKYFHSDILIYSTHAEWRAIVL